MNTAAKGRRNEWRSRKMFEALGYEVMRAAGSFGIFDFAAFSANDIVLVQCKTNRGALPHEREAMQMFKVPANVRKQVHIWKDRARAPVVKEL